MPFGDDAHSMDGVYAQPIEQPFLPKIGRATPQGFLHTIIWRHLLLYLILLLNEAFWLRGERKDLPEAEINIHEVW